MIGKIVSSLVPPPGYTVVSKKPRVAKLVTMSYHTAVLRSVARHNRPAVQPQWLRRAANAYERGDGGVSKRYVSERVFTYHVIGRGHGNLPS